jgi:hypothetical protein
MELKPGTRLRSRACATEVIVIRAPLGDVDIQCGGIAMDLYEHAAAVEAAPMAGRDGGTQIGKRYTTPEVPLEVLVTKPGAGSLTIADTPLVVKEAKPLPASD